MNEAKQQLLELVRKVDSEFHDPNVHGQGTIIVWNRRKNEIASSAGILKKIFNQKYYDFYFVKTHGKPIQIRNVLFEWFEGASNISLTLEASFQLKITNRQDAEKLITILVAQQSIAPDEALYQIIDEQLHNCLERIYARYQQGKEKKNLLDEFYLPDADKGESPALNADVTRDVNTILKGLEFKIGFTLRDAPDPVANFSHCTTLKKNPSRKEFNVLSECTIKLCSYQSYKKSGIAHLDDVIARMRNAIDQAIHEHVSGKSLFDLFSNFELPGDRENKSISTLVHDRVKAEAVAIGYELQSFYSLPDVAPLKLLKGIRIDLDEQDGFFRTGYGGGNIKINASMDIKADPAGFDRLMHLLSPSGDYEHIDVLEFTYSDLIQRIKKPIVTLCSTVIKQYTYKTASVEFDTSVRKRLKTELVQEMKALYGSYSERNKKLLKTRSYRPIEKNFSG